MGTSRGRGRPPRKKRLLQSSRGTTRPGKLLQTNRGDYTALNPEDSEEVTAEFNKLVVSFPRTLPSEDVLRPCVVIKAGDEVLPTCSSLPRVVNVAPQILSLARVPNLPSYAGYPSGSRVFPSPHPPPDPSICFLPIGSEEGYKSDHPYFVNTPYVLPSGVEVTDDSVSRPTLSLAAGLLQNYKLIPEVLRAMGVQCPSRLHD
ncbi:hypothetical protein LIER_35153 [Lithospermum erythrorhizon]|uniref:Uncharacterized protein n=1 Tax=Lithospermum erythrorhizon TaxID=34254 RepID=A0AAV3NKQ2_LITER